jgi:hypothetical protein
MPPPHHHDHDHHHHHHHDHHHHHHHHHHHFCERIWEDLPPSAVDAAKVLGYSAETWNAAKILPYLDKPFAKLTSDEKRACVYLSKSPIDYRMQEQWNDLDATLQKHAQVLGWDEHKWNKNDSIKEVECDHWWWQDMTEEQRAAGKYFGYNQNLWDEQGQEEEFSVSILEKSNMILFFVEMSFLTAVYCLFKILYRLLLLHLFLISIIST